MRILFNILENFESTQGLIYVTSLGPQYPAYVCRLQLLVGIYNMKHSNEKIGLNINYNVDVLHRY